MSDAEIARFGVLSSVDHCFKTRDYVSFGVGCGRNADGAANEEMVLIITFRNRADIAGEPQEMAA